MSSPLAAVDGRTALRRLDRGAVSRCYLYSRLTATVETSQPERERESSSTSCLLSNTRQRRRRRMRREYMDLAPYTSRPTMTTLEFALKRIESDAAADNAIPPSRIPASVATSMADHAVDRQRRANDDSRRRAVRRRHRRSRFANGNFPRIRIQWNRRLADIKQIGQTSQKNDRSIQFCCIWRRHQRTSSSSPWKQARAR